MEVIHAFPADFAAPGNAPTLHAVQYDGVRKIAVQLYSGTAAWPVREGVTAGIGYTLPNRQSGYYEALSDGTAACTIDGNTVQAVLAPILTSVAGLVQVSVVLRQGDEQLSTFPFRVRVAARPGVAEPNAQPDAVSTFVGKLYYGGSNGVPMPLAIGEGLDVEGGALRVPDAVGKAYVDAAVAELWAEINYAPIRISNFRKTPSVVVLGTVLDSVTLAWTLNKDPVTQALNDVLVASKARSVEQPGPFSETTKFTLTVTDEREAVDTASVKVYFYNYVYCGYRTSREMPLDTELQGMTGELQDTLWLTIQADAGTGEYVLYACPTRLGTPEFWANGFQGGFEKLGTMLHTNASGYAEEYDIWLSNAAGLSGVTITVK